MGRRKKIVEPVGDVETTEGVEQQETGSMGAVIMDDSLKPFFIKVEDNAFNLFKIGSPLLVGSYNKLEFAIKKVVQCTMAQPGRAYTLNEFIKGYETQVDRLLTAIGAKV